MNTEMPGTLTSCRNLLSLPLFSSLSCFLWVLWHSFRSSLYRAIRLKIRSVQLSICETTWNVRGKLRLQYLFSCGFFGGLACVVITRPWESFKLPRQDDLKLDLIIDLVRALQYFEYHLHITARIKKVLLQVQNSSK